MFGLFKKSSSESYSGNSSYKYINNLIRRGKELYIVSPYIDSYYATIIKNMSSGRRFRIIASSMGEGAERILAHKAPVLTLIVYLLSSIALSYLLFLVLHSPVVSAVVMIVYVLYAILISYTSRNDNIYLKIPKNFVHAKIYISETEAIVGSANLTYAGTHKNIEHIEIIHDEKRIAELRRDFFRMWDSA